MSTSLNSTLASNLLAMEPLRKIMYLRVHWIFLGIHCCALFCQSKFREVL